MAIVLSHSCRMFANYVQIAIAVCTLLIALPASSQQKLNTGLRLEQMLRDAETASGLVASGKLLYNADNNKETWSRYCAASVALANRGEFRQAVREASKALFLGQDTNNSNALAFASRDLAYAYSLAGDLGKAEEWAKHSLTHIAKSRLGRDRGALQAAVQKILGDIAIRREQYKEATEYYQAALSEIFFADPLQIPLKISIANAEIRRGGFDAARKILEQIKADDVDWGSFVLRAQGNLAFAERNFTLAARHFGDAVNKISGRNDPYNQMWMEYGLGQALAASGDREKALAAFRKAISSAQQLRTQFRSSEFRAGFFGDVQAIYDDAIGLLVDAKRFDEALALSEESRARTLIDALKGRAKDEHLDTTQAVANIPPNTAAAVFHVQDKRTIVWTVRSGATEVAVIPIGRKDLSVRVDGFRRAIVERSSNTLSHSRELYDLLINPLRLKPGEALVFIPHKALHYLPVQALTGAQGYLIEERAIATVPSLNTLLAISTSAAEVKPAMLAMGNPDLGNPALALPGAEQEVRNIGTMYPDAKIFIGKDATKPRFLSQAPGNGQIHIAAHATVDEIDPSYSSIRLAGGDLSKGDLEAHEILGMDLSAARLIVLSACQSGLGKVSGGDEFFGFKRSFLAAGARTLLVSLWSIEDESAAKLMTVFYRELRTSPLMEALRQAQLDLIKSPATRDPIFWAPFISVGAWQ